MVLPIPENSEISSCSGICDGHFPQAGEDVGNSITVEAAAGASPSAMQQDLARLIQHPLPSMRSCAPSALCDPSSTCLEAKTFVTRNLFCVVIATSVKSVLLVGGKPRRHSVVTHLNVFVVATASLRSSDRVPLADAAIRQMLASPGRQPSLTLWLRAS